MADHDHDGFSAYMVKHGVAKEKPHKGLIENWWKHPCGDEYGLGYLIRGRCVQHPNFGTTSTFHTSYVVKRDGNEIETLNSRYTLGKEYKETRSPSKQAEDKAAYEKACQDFADMGGFF